MFSHKHKILNIKFMNIESPLLSIIIPVYNVEKYIGRCLDSIISQTFTNWECIIIDDGSPDKSGIICDEYAKNDNRIQVIHKKTMELEAQEMMAY